VQILSVQIELACLQKKRRLMQLLLRILTLKPTNKYEIDLRTQLHGYRLDADPTCNTLWRLRDSGPMKDRQVVSEDMAFDTITRIHCLHAHPGKNKTFDFFEKSIMELQKKREVVIFFL